MNDTLLNKKVSLERCIQQMRAYYALDTGLPFAEDYLKQDAIAMNLQRACEGEGSCIMTRTVGRRQSS